MELKFFQEQIFFSTIRITKPNEDKTGASIGTGFIIKVSLNDEHNRAALLLLSNKHVYGDTKQPLLLNFHKKLNNEDKPDLGNVFTLSSDDFSDVYIEHPDNSIDLACLNISIIGNPKYNIFYKNLTSEMLSDFSEQDLLPGNDVWFIGYPENRFDVAHNLPLLRRGYISSIPKIDFNNNQQIIIDAQVHPGSSGSPVFTLLGNSFMIIGVVTQTMIKHGKLEIIPTTTNVGVTLPLGLGIVIKSKLIKELIDHSINTIKKRINSDRKQSGLLPNGA